MWHLPQVQLVQNALALVSGTSTGYPVLQDQHLPFGLITAGSGAPAAECHLIIRRTARHLGHFATFSAERPT